MFRSDLWVAGARAQVFAEAHLIAAEKIAVEKKEVVVGLIGIERRLTGGPNSSIPRFRKKAAPVTREPLRPR
ncbi:MAG: hypothetical protein WAM78_08435 [Candidatus Sulfotelmatobacter sp.]